jgi:hypothetical protein
MMLFYCSSVVCTKRREQPRFNIPTVPSSRVYVGAKREVEVYALLAQATEKGYKSKEKWKDR